MRLEPSVEYNPKPYVNHPQCIDCACYHFTDFDRVNRMLDAMKAKDSFVNLNDMSLGVCYKLGKVVCCYDMSCDMFEPSSIDLG